PSREHIICDVEGRQRHPSRCPGILGRAIPSSRGPITGAAHDRREPIYARRLTRSAAGHGRRVWHRARHLREGMMRATLSASPKAPAAPRVQLTQEAPATAAADWKAIGTPVRLVVTDPARLEAGRRLLEHDLAALDLAASRFRPDSELALVEQAAPGPMHVSP